MKGDMTNTMKATTTATMTDAEIERVIRAADGSNSALDDLGSLGVKIRRIAKSPKYSGLFRQLSTARDAGDLRGRLLEINFLDHFLRQGISLDHSVKQGHDGRGDIDFAWQLHGYQICFEIKLLGQDKKSRDAMYQQRLTHGRYATQGDEMNDIKRIQQAIISKSSTTKFNPRPEPGVINMIAIDVCELQLNCVDVADCLLAAGGNPLVSQFYHSACTRDSVIGLFENVPNHNLTDAQRQWVNNIHKTNPDIPPPRTYIHGALFLFRNRRDTAALSYELTAAVAWNPLMIEPHIRARLAKSIYGVIPRQA